MKRIILIISTTCICSVLWADIITVSNNPDSPGQYTSLQAAIDAAMDGDTLLIAGSPTTYVAITIDKKLRLIGAGMAPGYRQSAYTTILNLVGLSASLNYQGASGSSFEGIVFRPLSNNGEVVIKNIAAPIIIKGITVDRCYIFGKTNSPLNINYIEDLTIRNSILFSTYIKISLGVQNVIVLNNIFANNAYYISNPANTSNNIILNNNIFFGDDPFGSNTNIYSQFSQTYNILFSNNIFYRISPDPYGVTVENCVFDNNISFDATSNAFSITGLNTGANNIENSDPQFVSIAPGATSFTWTDDLHLAPGSPGENMGVDGSDIGIYGGSFPFPLGGQYDAGPAPAIPEITIMNILNTALKKTDQLQVQIKANSNN